MTGDLIRYISGWIPLGLLLPLIAGAAFTLIWYIVWAGTQFWQTSAFGRILRRGWIVIILAYMTAWLIRPPPSIPVRIIINAEYSGNGSAPDWVLAGIADAIESRLRSSDRSFTILSKEICPVLARENITSLEAVSGRMKVKWLIKVGRNPGETDDGIRIEISKSGGSGFSVKESISLNPEPFLSSALKSAEEVARFLGDRQAEEQDFFDMPENRDDLIARYYQALILTDTLMRDFIIAELEMLRLELPDWSSVQREYARRLFEEDPQKHKFEIKSALLNAIKINPKDSEALLLLGRFFEEFRNWTEAESALKLAYNVDPDDPRLYYYLSRLEQTRLQNLPFKSKFRLMKWALHLAPGYETARLAQSEFRTGNLERKRALEEINDGLKIDPESIPLLLSRSALQIQLSRREEAIKTLEDILAINPAHSGALYNYGVALVWLKKYDEAMAYFDSSLTNGGTIDNIFYKGVIHQRKNEYTEAIDCYQRRLVLAKSEKDKVAISAQERIKFLKKELGSGSGS